MRIESANVLEEVKNVFNYIITMSLMTKMFARLCEEMDAEHTSLVCL
jgi:hypothetical protein